jgi:hypothetical protein
MCEIKKEDYKICRKCNETLSINCFKKNPKLKSGYNGSCLSCSNRYIKKEKSKVIDGHKICSKCNILLPVENFRENPKLKSGLHSQCNSCANTYVKKLPSSKVVDGHKMCTKCDTLLPVDKFRENLKVKSGLHSYCIDCCVVPKKIREPKVIIPRVKKEPLPKVVKPPRIVDGKCVCSSCKELLPVDNFYVNKKIKDGISYECKVCRLSRNKKSHERNYKPGMYSEYRKQYKKNKRDERRVIRDKEKLIIQQEKERIKREKEELKLKNSISRTCKVCEIHKPVDEMKGFTCKKCCNIQKRERTKERMKTDDEFRKLKNRKAYERRLRRMEEDEEYKQRLSCKRFEREKRRLETDEEYKERKRVYVKEKSRRRFNNDPLYRFKKLLRNNVRNSFKRGGFSKTSECRKILGADWDVVKKYFESKFTEGMSWDNMGLWHIDHILPISTATCEEDVIRLNHYTNLQPLWGEDNLKKSNNMTYQGQLKEKFPYYEISVDSDNNVDIKVKPTPAFN